MGLDLSIIVSGRQTVTVEFCEQTAKVVYNPVAFTQDTMNRLDKEDEGMMGFILEVVVDWDICNGKKKVPLTVEGLSKLPIPLIREVALAVLGDRGDDLGEAKTNSKGG